MEKVNGLILYQVATNRNYRVGDKLIFDKNTITGQYEKVMNSSALYKNARMCDYLYKICDSKLKKIDKSETLQVAKILDAYDVTFRDLALEEVRKAHFPDYPSRLHSMYLSETKEEVLNNLNKMTNGAQSKLFQAIAVKLNGKIFKAGNSFSKISREGQSYSYYLQRAKEYWTHESKDNPLEILFEGKAEIIEIIEEIHT